ncbi:MAG: hypothetical protein IKB42_03300 [Clostridia bacterium]|nr:hypothetical protein [Clostridia bacterium]
MLKSKLSFLVFMLIFAISFAIPSIFLVSTIQSVATAQEIVKNGTITTATPVNKYSNLTVNDVKYYYITYTFEVDGVTYEGETSPRYTESQAYSVFKSGNGITIAYDKDFNSIEANYTITEATKVEIIMLSIFALVDLGFWITVIVFVVKIIKHGLLNLLGKKEEATFVAIKPGIVVNNVPKYRINYCWRNDLGEVCEDTTDSDYTLSQARAFEIAGKFDILYYKKMSRITSKPNKLFFQQAEEEHLTVDDVVVCNYCQSVFKSDLGRCSSCGAPLTKKQTKYK